MTFLDVTNAEVPSFDAIPAGDYILQVEDAEVKTTKAGTGEYINAKLTVVGGEFENRKIFMMFNIRNPNQQAVNIGMGQLKAMMQSSGRTNYQLESVVELCGLTFAAKVGVRKDYQDEDQNYVKSFLAHNPAITAKAQTAQTGQTAFVNNNDIPF